VDIKSSFASRCPVAPANIETVGGKISSELVYDMGRVV
jgi:hypothetical protein